jgi:hypothetical protein
VSDPFYYDFRKSEVPFSQLRPRMSCEAESGIVGRELFGAFRVRESGENICATPRTPASVLYVHLDSSNIRKPAQQPPVRDPERPVTRPRPKSR